MKSNNQATIVPGGIKALCNYLDKLEKFGVSGQRIVAILADPVFCYTVIYKYPREISTDPKDVLTEEEEKKLLYT